LAVAGIFVIGAIGDALGNGTSSTGKSASNAATASTPRATVAASSTAVARKPSFTVTHKPSPAVVREPSFPPTTLAGFRAFAATGDASQVHQVATSSEGLPSCPEPNSYVTVSPALTGKALEADLSAFFVQSGFLSSQCQAFVFAYHSMSDYQANKDNGFTAGRVALTTNSGSSPQFNLEVDTGSATSEQTEFDFNF
jgi:hypothetical protein